MVPSTLPVIYAYLHFQEKQSGFTEAMLSFTTQNFRICQNAVVKVPDFNSTQPLSDVLKESYKLLYKLVIRIILAQITPSKTAEGSPEPRQKRV